MRQDWRAEKGRVAVPDQKGEDEGGTKLQPPGATTHTNAAQKDSEREQQRQKVTGVHKKKREREREKSWQSQRTSKGSNVEWERRMSGSLHQGDRPMYGQGV